MTHLILKNKRFKYLLLLISGALIFWGLFTLLLKPSHSTYMEKAASADSFIDSIGVAVHLNYTDTAYHQNYEDIIKPRLQELGIRHIRGGFSLKSKTSLERTKELAEIGIKSTLVMDPRRIESPEEALKIVKEVRNAVEAVEGPNEWDLNSSLQYRGKSFPQGVKQFQKELYTILKTDPATTEIDIICPSVGRPYNSEQLGELPCDFGNMHSYAGGKQPSNQLDSKWIPQAQVIAGNRSIIATECGYHNLVTKRDLNHQPGVSELAASKYLIRLFLEYFNRGIKRAYTYELIDLKPDIEAKKPNWNYGLLRNDGSRKPDFIALKNLMAILQETSQKVPRSISLQTLEYTITGNTKNIHHTLLQKKDGTLYFILWQEVLSFDQMTKKNIEIQPRKLTLTLNRSLKQARTYQPLVSSQPIETYDRPQLLEIQVLDHPLMIELINR
ncbi:MAG: hypothetical protein VKK42_02215 [Lyngbya sp.]|nr:hypothetical protein [Lyngbya sp.]